MFLNIRVGIRVRGFHLVFFVLHNVRMFQHIPSSNQQDLLWCFSQGTNCYTATATCWRGEFSMVPRCLVCALHAPLKTALAYVGAAWQWQVGKKTWRVTRQPIHQAYQSTCSRDLRRETQGFFTAVAAVKLTGSQPSRSILPCLPVVWFLGEILLQQKPPAEFLMILA